MRNPKLHNILQLFKLFVIEILTARAGLHLKQQKKHRG